MILTRHPGALCGIAFAAGILAQVDGRPLAWSAIVTAGVIVLLRVEWRQARADRTAISRRLVIAVVFFVLGAARYRATLETCDPLIMAAAHGPITIVGTVVRPPLERAPRGAAPGGTETSLEILCRNWNGPVRIYVQTPLPGVRGGDTIRVTSKTANFSSRAVASAGKETDAGPTMGSCGAALADESDSAFPTSMRPPS